MLVAARPRRRRPRRRARPAGPSLAHASCRSRRAEVDYPLRRRVRSTRASSSRGRGARLARAAAATRDRHPAARGSLVAAAAPPRAPRAARSARPSSAAGRPREFSGTSRSRPRSCRPRSSRHAAVARRRCAERASSISTSSSTRWTASRPAPTPTGPAARPRADPGGRRPREAAFLCLEQALGGDASADRLLPRADLDAFSAASATAAIARPTSRPGLTGGRRYLAAYAQGFGATGLTFYDAEVVEFFSPHAAGQATRSSSPRSAARLARATAC